MRGYLTTALDTLGLLLFAAGMGALTYRWIGWTCLSVAGMVVLAGSALAALGSPKRGEAR
jgi:hypothetical protein